MNTPARALRARNLLTLAALAALFLLPLAVAFFTYYGTAWRRARPFAAAGRSCTSAAAPAMPPAAGRFT